MLPVLNSRYVPPHLRSSRGPGSEEKPFSVPQERGIILSDITSMVN